MDGVHDQLKLIPCSVSQCQCKYVSKFIKALIVSYLFLKATYFSKAAQWSLAMLGLVS